MFIENLEVFYELARWGEESDAYTIVSKKYVPFYEDLRDFFERRIYTIANSEEIEYVYMRYSAYSSGTMYGMAVAPEAVSARLSYQSTKEDIIDVFGAEYCKQKSYDMGYIIPELENTSGIIVYVKLEDCEIYVFMDETGNQIVDYIYILGEK